MTSGEPSGTGGSRDGEGRIAGTSHLFPVRVYWEDTDAGGIVYHANYLRFFERARSDLLTCLGIRQQALLLQTGLAFAVTGMTLRFRRPAKLEDRLTVTTSLKALGGASMTLEQVASRDVGPEPDGPQPDSPEPEVLVVAEVRAALIDRAGRPRRLPDHISAAFGPVAATLSPKSSRNSDIEHRLGRGHGN